MTWNSLKLLSILGLFSYIAVYVQIINSYIISPSSLISFDYKSKIGARKISDFSGFEYIDNL